MKSPYILEYTGCVNIGLEASESLHWGHVFAYSPQEMKSCGYSKTDKD